MANETEAKILKFVQYIFDCIQEYAGPLEQRNELNLVLDGFALSEWICVG